MQIILGSESPRKIQLLKQIIGDNFTTASPNYEEDNTLDMAPKDLVMFHALNKARSIKKEGIIISADCLTFADNKALGKPKNEEVAKQTLKAISDQNITVLTGIAIKTPTQEITDYETTTLKIKPLSEKEIQDYVDTKEPLDKAGAFGIQGKGALIVEKINGCYYNVVGLPLFKLSKMLKQIGIDALAMK